MLGALTGIFATTRFTTPEVELIPISPPIPYQIYAYGLAFFNSGFSAMGFAPASPYPSYSYRSDVTGQNWTMTNQGVQAEYRSMIVGPDRLVLTAGNTNTSNKNTVSTDGSTWSHYTGMPFSAYWYGSAYDGTYYVASNFSNTTFAQSLDGITWTSRPTSGLTSGIEALAYNGAGLYLGGQRSNANVFRSLDGGFTWSVAGPRPYGFVGLRYENGLFFAQDYLAGGIIAASSDGTSWTTYSMPGTGVFSNPIWVANKGKWVSRANAGGTQSWIVWSEDLVNWNQLAVPSEIQGKVGTMATDGNIVMGLSVVNGAEAYAYRISGL